MSWVSLMPLLINGLNGVDLFHLTDGTIYVRPGLVRSRETHSMVSLGRAS